MKRKILIAVTFALFVTTIKASSEGVDHSTLDNYLITGFSRPCCSFGLDTMGVKMGIAAVIEPAELGEHHFARVNKNKDNVGMVYTCGAGFVDVSHLRDNADWSAHIYLKLREWLGSGKEILARREGGFKKRAVYFPELSTEELAELNEDDLEQLAISIGFNMALLHEIPTSFKFPVSVPSAIFTNEMSSAFSLEDAYSNLLGNILGAHAARSALPFNQAMTDFLLEELTELEAQPKANTFAAYEMVRNEWWIRGFNSTFKNILKRDFTYEGEISPRQVANTPFCSRLTVPKKILIPKVLSNGRTVDDYYKIRGMMNKKFKKGLKKLNISISNPLTQSHYPQVIQAIKADFIRQLGKDI